MKRKLLIVLRTCQRVNMIHDNGSGRYIKVSKHELINVCMSSLVDSINRVTGHDIDLVVLDDHSIPEAVKDIKAIMGKCKFPSQFIPLDVTGNADSLAQVYGLVEQRASDLWYHVEDDYLHFPTAIQDMLDSVDAFEYTTGKMVAINPHDDAWRYRKEIYPSFILHGPYRHYRTVKHTTYTCLASRKLYDKYRHHFQDVVNLTRQRADWVEDKTINLVWNKDDVMLFSPIPGLALHIMDESGMDPYINVSDLWDSIPELWNNLNMEHFYQNLHGWFNFQPLYASMINQAKPGDHFVEVGAWQGKSASFMAVEIVNRGIDLKFDIVDTWAGSLEHMDDQLVQTDMLYQKFLDNMKPVEAYYTPLRMTSLEAATKYADNSLDFVLLDASHEYPDVKADILAWLPKVKPGAILAGDDECWPGVRQAVQELLPGASVDQVTWIYKKPLL